eukprot:152974-Pelagomonas_calceolata.AAC.1
MDIWQEKAEVDQVCTRLLQGNNLIKLIPTGGLRPSGASQSCFRERNKGVAQTSAKDRPVWQPCFQKCDASTGQCGSHASRSVMQAQAGVAAMLAGV